ncbi:unnamed protein product [Cylicocyclus nassatus]|uniref:Uncharacterized protein n=1 Tax=Cylicocyclus nassatus TaxID=53992 RepID=A0AA36M517_CYLNA|nr:unnamed protein product [Cylicocyclus nassatus]
MMQDEAVDILQQINNVSATICSIFIHVFIIYRIRTKYSVFTQYQNLLVVQSSIYAVGSISQLLGNTRITLDGNELQGYWFTCNPKVLDIILEYTLDMTESAESIVIAVFNLHRVLLFVRPYLLRSFYLIVIPIAILYCICHAYVNAIDKNYAYYSKIGFFLIICSAIIICYIILRRYFASNISSKRVRRMQAHLSKGIVAQICVHITAIALLGLWNPINIVLGLFFERSKKTEETVFKVYLVVAYTIFVWYSAVIGLIIRWSIIGILTRIKPAQTSSFVI